MYSETQQRERDEKRKVILHAINYINKILKTKDSTKDSTKVKDTSQRRASF